MESAKPFKKQGTKKRLLYNRQRTYSVGDVDEIFNKEPELMTENEKVIWKVEILKNSEDMDDLLDLRIKQI